MKALSLQLPSDMEVIRTEYIEYYGHLGLISYRPRYMQMLLDTVEASNES